MADTKLVICEKCWGTGHVNGGNENSTWSKTCEDCHGIVFSRVPITNADRIRSMTDDELNDLFHEIYNAGVDDASSYEWGHRTNGFEWTMDWLQQPAEDD